MLKAHDLSATKHSAVESLIGKHFSKTGRIDRRFHKILIEARKVREIADYEVSDEVDEPVARLILENAKAFIEEIERLLSERG